ncbi:MAG TPA: hypothetical protein VHL31_25985 [Geminicoccus sp.]|jgi:class 3 adenylate cyclase|uniref:hypothetical protein n=1 Tax=Geminicoccus sp. TaxID=2024832 RepID=UPI002E30FC16|nr:hypothetical protein [Geminicoccus sp.]HEX2529726.1 hypothetical protein [Geminicoccus sp.]
MNTGLLTVNLAARLEAANKDRGTWLLVSEATLAASAARFRFRAISTIAIRHKHRPASVYTVA